MSAQCQIGKTLNASKGESSGSGSLTQSDCGLNQIVAYIGGVTGISAISHITSIDSVTIGDEPIEEPAEEAEDPNES